MLSDRDIQEALNKGDIIIEPFDPNSLTPVGYDMRVGEFAFSWKKKERIMIEKQPGKKLRIEPGDSMLISTPEKIKVSPRIGGTVHSKVSMTTTGFAHVSTTIDPGWPGPEYPPGHLLVGIHNQRDIPLELLYQEPLCTVCFYEVNSEATYKTHPNASLAQNPWSWLGDIESKARSLERQRFIFPLDFWFIVLAILIAGISITFFKPTDFQDWIQLAGVVALFIIAAFHQRVS